MFSSVIGRHAHKCWGMLWCCCVIFFFPSLVSSSVVVLDGMVRTHFHVLVALCLPSNRLLLVFWVCITRHRASRNHGCHRPRVARHEGVRCHVNRLSCRLSGLRCCYLPQQRHRHPYTHKQINKNKATAIQTATQPHSHVLVTARKKEKQKENTAPRGASRTTCSRNTQRCVRANHHHITPPRFAPCHTPRPSRGL